MNADDRFDALYRSHAGAVRRYAARRSDLASADDIVSDVFVVAWRRLDEIPAEPLPWLLGVARRVLGNRRRSVARAQALRRRIGAELPVGMAAAVTAAAGSEGATDDGAVARALASLGDADRQALLLVGWEGLAPREAAELLGISANTFAARLSRARRRFARALAASGAGVIVASIVVALMIGAGALAVLHRAHAAATTGGRAAVASAPPLGGGRVASAGDSGAACRSRVRDQVLPVWARAGFSARQPRMPFELGVAGRIGAIVWGGLRSPALPEPTNKILWVARVPGSGAALRISAQRMAGTKRVGGPVLRTVVGGPGPSIINLPAPGCWRLTVRWGSSSDRLDLVYTRPG